MLRHRGTLRKRWETAPETLSIYSCKKSLNSNTRFPALCCLAHTLNHSSETAEADRIFLPISPECPSSDGAKQHTWQSVGQANEMHYLHGNAVFARVLNETHPDAPNRAGWAVHKHIKCFQKSSLVKAKHAGQVFAYNVGTLRQKARFQGAFLEIGYFPPLTPNSSKWTLISVEFSCTWHFLRLLTQSVGLLSKHNSQFIHYMIPTKIYIFIYLFKIDSCWLYRSIRKALITKIQKYKKCIDLNVIKHI